MANLHDFATKVSSNSTIKAEFTIEQLKEAANCGELKVFPANGNHKCFFACGSLSGCVSKNIENKLFVEGEIPQMKVIAVEKTTADEFGGPFKGLQLVEAKSAEGAIIL